MTQLIPRVCPISLAGDARRHFRKHGGVRQQAKSAVGGEDVAVYAQEIPSVFVALGQGSKAFSPEPGLEFDTTVTVHNGRFVLHEDLLRRGVALHAHLALSYLDRAAET